MTKIRFYFKREDIVIIEVKGHALADNYGKDIVCSSISSTVIMTINGILEVIGLKEVGYVVKEGYVRIEISSGYEKTNILTKSLYSFMKDLEERYPKNVKIETEEV